MKGNGTEPCLKPLRMWTSSLELISFKISDLFFEEGFIKITGKGNKQRFVPIGNLTKKYIEIYKIRCKDRC